MAETTTWTGTTSSWSTGTIGTTVVTRSSTEPSTFNKYYGSSNSKTLTVPKAVVTAIRNGKDTKFSGYDTYSVGVYGAEVDNYDLSCSIVVGSTSYGVANTTNVKKAIKQGTLNSDGTLTLTFSWSTPWVSSSSWTERSSGSGVWEQHCTISFTSIYGKVSVTYSTADDEILGYKTSEGWVYGPVYYCDYDVDNTLKWMKAEHTYYCDDGSTWEQIGDASS